MNEAEKTLAELFQVEQMTEIQQAAFYQQVGSLVLDAALGRLLLTLDDAEVSALQTHLETASEDENLLEYLLATYPAFQTILIEEAKALEKEGRIVVGDL